MLESYKIKQLELCGKCMKKITLEEFIKKPKDSKTIITVNDIDLFIFTKDPKEILELIDPKNQQKEQKCTEK